MKLSKTQLATLVTFVFITTVYADADILESCKKAETSFWDAMAETYSSADQTFMETIDEQVQMSYYKMALKKIDGSISEVRKGCKGVASKEILDAYNQKKSKIANKMNAL